MTAPATKWVYTFGGGKAEGSAAMDDLLGGKGANLAEMSSMGLPVPPGFTITTGACNAFFDNNGVLPEGLQEQQDKALAWMGGLLDASLGGDKPLLVSVRSGAQASMPGMMDTVLNLGLNDRTADALARRTADPRFAYDSYRRFIQMYADVVLGVEHHNFEDILELFKEDRQLRLDTELTADDWREMVADYKEKVEQVLGAPFPQDVRTQLQGAIAAVFGSWRNARAATYRRLHRIPEGGGTAVNVQAMVFGNKGRTSATGVAFTRNPSTGAKELYGEFLPNAQGEDVVAGIRTPHHLTRAAARALAAAERTAAEDDAALCMEEAMPELFAGLAGICARLEAHYRDVQDVEFTIQEGVLWMLQTRTARRTASAALKAAVDMVGEGMISRKEAVRRVDPASLDQLLHPTLDPAAPREVIARGLPASPGAASGEIVFDAGEAEALKRQGRRVILVRVETSPEDIHGMHAAEGVITTRGGMTSHAAVVARGMGRPCVCGAGAIRVDYAEGLMAADGVILRKGEAITLDGATGEVIRGRVAQVQPDLTGDFATLMQWAGAYRRMAVRANADMPADASAARRFGAQGIGLCRTEHMFFDQSRIQLVRQMILARDTAGRERMLQRILPLQRRDFLGLFQAMSGQPVTIRLLDPPLHEFLPRGQEELEQTAKVCGVTLQELRRRVAELEEFNPMLGHRGCRLGISYPEIYRMQARAIFEAAGEAGRATGKPVQLEIMIPLVTMRSELDWLAERITSVAEEVAREKGSSPSWLLGTMIELPRAALRAASIAGSAEFFSFGTNDLTQTVFGISRDDSARFLADYMDKGLMAHDPFVSLDQEGVGEMVRMAVERGRAARPGIKLGICGEHGGDPASIGFCARLGLDYISCSPYRVPVAQLAAAQAALEMEDEEQDGGE